MKNILKIFNRRPLFMAALFFTAGILACFYFKIPFLVSAISAIFLFLLSVLSSMIKRRLHIFIYPALFFTGAILITNALALENLYIQENKAVSFTARVAELPEKTDYGYAHILDEINIEGMGKINGHVRFTSENEYNYGSVLQIKSKLKKPEGVVNPGGYDEKLTLLSKGVILKAYASNARVLYLKQQDLYGYLLKAKTFIKNLICRIYPTDVKGLALGMFLGDISGLSDETYTAYKATGAAHILAVSGLNVGIIIFVFFTLLKLLHIPKKPRYFLTLVFIAAYACITGLGPSIVRASVMAVFLLTVRFTGQKTDPLIVISAAWMFILVLNPIDLFMPGFLLSFGAVFGMVTTGSILHGALRNWPKIIKDTVSANFGASLGTMPILASRFYSVSALSFFSNILIVPLSSVATIVITISVIAGAICLPLSVPFVIISAGFMRWIGNIVYLFSLIPFISMPVGALNTMIVVALFVFMFLASQYLLLKPKVKKTLCIVLAIVIITGACLFYMPYHGFYMAFLDVGQGDSVFIRTPSGTSFLVDGGDEWAATDITSFLDYKGFSLDFVFLTHPHNDHMEGILKLIEKGRVKKVYTTQAVCDTQKLKGVAVTVLKKGDRLIFGDILIKVLNPENTDGLSENDTSLVLDLKYKKFHCLLTGDISSKIEKSILQDIQKTDIIKTAHHGADTSNGEELLDKIKPDYAVVSVGINTYGHPGAETLKRLKRYAQVFRTDINHAVEFYISDTIDVRPFVS